MWGFSILLFSFIMESTFLVSKGLLCLYDKENNTWLLLNTEFLFSCSTRHLPRSLWDVTHVLQRTREMSQAGQNYSMLIGWDKGLCFLITGALLVIDSGNFGKILQIREKEILNCTRALRLHIQSKSWHHERLIQKAKAKWKVSAVPTYCKSKRCCQIELCALSGTFVSCHAQFYLGMASWHFEIHV